MERARAAEQAGDGATALQAYEAALVGLEEKDPRTADVLRWIGTVHRNRGETQRAERRYRESLELSQRVGYLLGQAHAVNWLAVIAMGRGNLREAEATFKRARRLAKDAGEARLVGAIEQNLGILANIRGDLDSALVHYRSALNQFEASRDDEMRGLVLNNVGMLHTDLRHWDEAHRAFEQAMALARATGNPLLENAVEVNCAELYVACNEWAEATAAAERALILARHRGDRLREAEALKFRAVVERERDDVALAERDLREADHLATQGEDRLLQAEVAREIGDLFLQTGRADDARASFFRALDLFRGVGASLDARDVETRLNQLPATA